MIKLSELFELQNDLDKIIVDNNFNCIGNRMSRIDHNDNRFLSDRIMALSIEVSEFANQVEAFKYWKNNKRDDKAKQLSEYVDILHFWLSIGNTMKFTPKEVEAAYHKKYKENIERQRNGY